MNQEYFTPGPWFRKGQRVYWKNPDKDLPRGTLPNGSICVCKSAEDWPECNAEARANARLIATAPKLYDKLKEAAYEFCHNCLSLRLEREEDIPMSDELIEKNCPLQDNGCFCRAWWDVLKEAKGGAK